MLQTAEALFGQRRVQLAMSTQQERRPHLSEEWLRKKYWGDGLSVREMAEEAGASRTAVLSSMDTRGVERRSSEETAGRPRYEDDAVRRDVERVVCAIGRRPSTSDYEHCGEYSCTAVVARWGDGTWASALDELGVDS